MFCVTDVTRGIIAICDTYENACEICDRYCDMEYHDAPEMVEDVFIQYAPLNETLY